MICQNQTMSTSAEIRFLRPEDVEFICCWLGIRILLAALHQKFHFLFRITWQFFVVLKTNALSNHIKNSICSTLVLSCLSKNCRHEAFGPLCRCPFPVSWLGTIVEFAFLLMARSQHVCCTRGKVI